MTGIGGTGTTGRAAFWLNFSRSSPPLPRIGTWRISLRVPSGQRTRNWKRSGVLKSQGVGPWSCHSVQPPKVRISVISTRAPDGSDTTFTDVLHPSSASSTRQRMNEDLRTMVTSSPSIELALDAPMVAPAAGQDKG